jgi:hypothetical protein
LSDSTSPHIVPPWQRTHRRPRALAEQPVDDITNTRAIAAVVADGRYFSHQVIEQLRKRLRQLAVTR